MSNTVLDKTRDGDPRPAGDIDLDPGGDSVEAYKEAAEGFDLRKASDDSEGEVGKGSIVEVECLI
jgi:hypothetical protein